MVDRRVESKFVCKEESFCFCIKIAIFCEKNTKTVDLDALEVTVFVKWENQAILIQNILILRIICIKYVIITSFTPK